MAPTDTPKSKATKYRVLVGYNVAGDRWEPGVTTDGSELSPGTRTAYLRDGILARIDSKEKA